jgi:hypothetical protein
MIAQEHLINVVFSDVAFPRTAIESPFHHYFSRARLLAIYKLVIASQCLKMQ